MLGSWPKGFHKFAHNKTKSLPKLGLLMLVHHTHTHAPPQPHTHMWAYSAIDRKRTLTQTDEVYIQFPGQNAKKPRNPFT